MKIKITLIAFFASVLFLTSCMKNEVSPGIEEVRSAYAAFLNAKAQALIIQTNADAELTRAQAAVQTANAALTDAQAAGVEAATLLALENLAQAIEMNKIALAAAQRADQVLADAYALAVQTAKNTAVALYFGNYNAAILAVNTIEDLILDKQKQIVDLQIDLINGTDVGLTNAKAALAAGEAKLAALQAELADAKAILGDDGAVAAKLAELVNDSVQLEVLIATLEIDKKMEEPNFADETAAEATAWGKYLTAKGKKLDADTALMTAEADFLNDTVGTFPVPDFWQAALDSVANTNTRLTNGATDTLASATAMRNAQALIAAGTTAIDAEIADTLQSIQNYADSITKYFNDSVIAGNNHDAAVKVFTDAQADTAGWHAELAVLTDSLTAQRARYTPPDPTLLVTITDNAADSTVLEARITIAETSTLPDAKSDSLATWNLLIIADADLNAAVTGARAVFGGLTTTAEATLGSATIPTGLYLTKANLVTAIANATAALPDLISDYLYHQTFIPDLVEAVALAEAYKEAVRPDYETWKAEFYAAYYADLVADQAAKATAMSDAYDAWELADDALTAAKAAWTVLNKAQIQAAADLATVKAFQVLYGNVGGIYDNFVAGFEAAIAAQEALIPGLVTAVANAEAAYATGLVNYDKYTADLVELNARLAAAQAQVVMWKALLDEAIAAN